MATTNTTTPVTTPITGTTNTIREIKPMTLPTAYTSLGIVSGYVPLEPKELRMFILGPSGGGKTTFMAGIPRTLILDFERGAWGVPNPQAHRVHIKDAATLHKVVAQLIADGKSPSRPFDRVVFDTLDQGLDVLNVELAEQYKVADITQYGSHGAGYAILKGALWNIMVSIQDAGYSWTCIGHLTEKSVTVNKVERTVMRPVAPDSIAKLVGRNSDLFAIVRVETYMHTPTRMIAGVERPAGSPVEKHRVILDTYNMGGQLTTTNTKRRGVPTLDSKIELPDPMTGQLGWDSFVLEYNKAVAAVKGNKPSA